MYRTSKSQLSMEMTQEVFTRPEKKEDLHHVMKSLGSILRNVKAGPQRNLPDPAVDPN